VGINPWVIHRRTDIFGEDVEDFRPERWLDGDEDQIAEMRRNLFSVRNPLTLTADRIAIEIFADILAVWCGSTDVHRQEHRYDAVVQIHFRVLSPLRGSAGQSRKRVAGSRQLGHQTDRHGHACEAN
jgi:cytochrome P450